MKNGKPTILSQLQMQRLPWLLLESMLEPVLVSNMVRINQLTNLLGTPKLVVNLKRIRLVRLMVPILPIQMVQIKDHHILVVAVLKGGRHLEWEQLLITITLKIMEQVLQILLVNRLQKLLAVPLLKLLVVPYHKRLDKPWALQVVLT